ncbi:hypothetical protein PLICRDRAFT_695827 [Plicaturopsis crispa FD-325 SS-3]|nr:hypothetical protein PLICRDRAFT_695827 [Plicaturopsis crispa FD-325 SS-3]
MSRQYDSSDFSLPSSNARLLSESPPVHSSSSNTSDLSISELSLSDKPKPKPFSLLAHPTQAAEALLSRGGGSDEEDDDGAFDATIRRDDVGGEAEESPEEVEKRARLDAQKREEKLQNDLFILRKLNSAFALYSEALQSAQSGAERIMAQLEQTDALLNKYSNILDKSEAVTRLIFDERWEGAEVDEEVMEQEIAAAQEKARREAEERALAAQRERERIEREERERQIREQQERERREKAVPTTKVGGSGVRGVRGTRASMRGTARGTRGAPATRGRSSGGNSAQTDSGGTAAKRPVSVSSLRPPTIIPRGLSRPS